MSKKPLDPKSKVELEKLKTKLSSEVGMEFNDEIYKGRSSLKLTHYIADNISNLVIKNIVEPLEKNLLDKH
ncbi:alpha/beta-type small acid-soluble spore protein [Clostridium sp. SHJSY1]|uniref:small acid-soluble spore protein n=1 Tax=Clostridium sp. SHJSY1 TaxID=2942483 RepID=UPI0028761CF0|nr:small acid-soluble spore protein [Clostridium sp. SHJSY1]MDS0527770.1 alpha/beta-type small acid-soluble spore protein [Clostridium sp. SHJSY1]